MLQCPHMGTSAREASGFLLETVSALIGTGGLREFDRVLARELTRRLRCDAAGLYLYNQSAHSFTPASSNFADPAHLTHQVGQLPASGTMKEAAVRTGTALVCEDVLASRWTEGTVVAKAGFRSAVMAPLLLYHNRSERREGRPIAVVFVAARAGAAFSEADRRLLQELALQIAPVLQHVLAAEERDTLMALASRVVVGTVTIDSLLPAITDFSNGRFRTRCAASSGSPAMPMGPGSSRSTPTALRWTWSNCAGTRSTGWPRRRCWPRANRC